MNAAKANSHNRHAENHMMKGFRRIVDRHVSKPADCDKRKGRPGFNTSLLVEAENFKVLRNFKNVPELEDRVQDL